MLSKEACDPGRGIELRGTGEAVALPLVNLDLMKGVLLPQQTLHRVSMGTRPTTPFSITPLRQKRKLAAGAEADMLLTTRIRPSASTSSEPKVDALSRLRFDSVILVVGHLNRCTVVECPRAERLEGLTQ